MLVLDASGATVRTGLLGGASGDRWLETGDEALVSIFAGARSLLAEAGQSWSEIRTIALCRGPGSVLGLRVAALAAATWLADGAGAPVLVGYRSLDAAAQAALDVGMAPPFTVCADFKEGRWVLLRVRDSTDPLRQAALETVAADEAVAPPGETVLHLPMRKRWRPPPSEAQVFQPTSGQLGSALRRPGLLSLLNDPADLELGPAPVYQRWTGERHRQPKS